MPTSFPSSWDFGVDPLNSSSETVPAATKYGATDEELAIDSTPLGFGKYHDKTPDQLINIDPGYLIWCNDAINRQVCSPKLLEAAREIAAKLPPRTAPFGGGYRKQRY